MPKYVMVVRVDPELSAAAREAGEGDDVDQWVEEGERTGMRLEGDALEARSTATTVRVRDSEVLLTDGPFAEQKEFVAGYDLLDAPDLDAAADYASRHPLAKIGALELREVWEDFVGVTNDVAGARSDGVEFLFLHTPEPALLAAITWEQGDPSAWMAEKNRRGAGLGGWRLRDRGDDAMATVRVRDGATLVTRGPFAEVAEQIAGLDRLRVADLDEALELAATHPTARIGAIEVRPIMVW